MRPQNCVDGVAPSAQQSQHAHDHEQDQRILHTPLVTHKPFDQCTFAMAINIAAIIITGPSGLRSPEVSRRPPANSPRAANSGQVGRV